MRLLVDRSEDVEIWRVKAAGAEKTVEGEEVEAAGLVMADAELVLGGPEAILLLFVSEMFFVRRAKGAAATGADARDDGPDWNGWDWNAVVVVVVVDRGDVLAAAVVVLVPLLALALAPVGAWAFVLLLVAVVLLVLVLACVRSWV